MKKRANPLSKFKLVFRPGKTSTKIALLAVIVLSTATLLTIHGANAVGKAREKALLEQAAALEQSNRELEQRIRNLGSDQSVMEIAEEELGLVDPDTVIFNPR